MSKEKANEILVATSDIASHQKRSEQLRSDNSQLEAELQYRDNAFNQRKRTLGECEVSLLCPHGLGFRFPASRWRRASPPPQAPRGWARTPCRHVLLPWLCGGYPNPLPLPSF